MPEVRIDPLTGLRAIVGADPAAVLAGDAPEPAGQAARQLLQALPATGAHERLALPGDLATLDAVALAEVLEGWRARLRAHADASCVQLVAAGAEAHLLALPFVPAQIARERERFAAYAAANYGSNLLQDLVGEEVKLGERLVAIDDEAVLLVPWAARAPYEVTVVPRRPRPRFEDDGPLGAALLADALRRVSACVDPGTPLDLWLRTAPRGADPFCWHLDVVPRADPLPGLVRGAGLHVVETTPEQAAAALRAA